jgi:hypothetical protein
MDKFHIYLHFPKNIDEYVHDAEDVNNVIEELAMLIIRADCEKGTELYYDGGNLDVFVENIKVVADCGEAYDFQSPDLRVYELLEKAKDTTLKPSFSINEYTYYGLWNFDNKELSNNFSDIFKEITERKLIGANKTNEKYLLINIFAPLQFNRNFISILKDSSLESNIILPQFVFIEYVADFKSLEEWFEKNRLTRNYTFDDYRHIEGHKDYIPKKSPLLNGDKKHAESLLKQAIGDKRAKAYLINFDEKNKCYIRFEYENDTPQNQYHAYHLVHNKRSEKPYQRDEKAEKEIPERILVILEYRKKIKKK